MVKEEGKRQSRVTEVSKLRPRNILRSWMSKEDGRRRSRGPNRGLKIEVPKSFEELDAQGGEKKAERRT
jgi:hypothetical protein